MFPCVSSLLSPADSGCSRGTNLAPAGSGLHSIQWFVSSSNLWESKKVWAVTSYSLPYVVLQGNNCQPKERQLPLLPYCYKPSFFDNNWQRRDGWPFFGGGSDLTSDIFWSNESLTYQKTLYCILTCFFVCGVLMKTLNIPKDVITHNSKSMVCLAVYDQHLHTSLSQRKQKVFFINAQNADPATVNHKAPVKTYWDRMTLVFKPLLWVQVHYLPPGQKGTLVHQVDLLQTWTLCTLPQQYEIDFGL